MEATKTVKDRLLNYMSENRITQSAVARSIGVSPATVNLYLSDKYNAEVDTLEQKILGFLTRESEKAAIPIWKPAFVPTFISNRILDTARFAHLEREIGVVVGDPGSGKTVALKEYAKANPDVILVEADPGYTAKALFDDICLRVGCQSGQSLHRMFTDVVEKLRDSGRMIILDEAENLPYRALEMTRRVHDKAEIGILLVGMPRLMDNLRGKRGEYAQLYSRVGKLTNLNHLRGEHPDAIKQDAEKIVKALLPESNGIWKDFYSRSKGNPRVLVKLVRRAIRLGESAEVPINAEIVARASNMLMY